MPLLHKALQVDQIVHKWHLVSMCSRISSFSILECKHMTLAISMLNNIFQLHVKMQNYDLKYPNVIH